MEHKPYTYLIGWSNLDIWYYGRRTAKACNPEELWVKYFTSSKEVSKFRKLYGEPNIIQIRRTFKDTKSCSLWESKVLKRINAEKNGKFLNKKNGDYLWDRSGVKESEETKRKKSLSHVGKKLGPLSVETKLKISKTLTGKPGNNKGKKFGPAPIKRINKFKESVSREYILISPEGNTIKVKNLAQYCRDNADLKLCYPHLIGVAKGKFDNSKGWKCTKLTRI